jgi:IS1 family transposase
MNDTITRVVGSNEPNKKPRKGRQILAGANHNRLSPECDLAIAILTKALEKGKFVMANNLPREKQIEVLHHLVEGNTLRSATRLSGVHRTTIMKLMVKFGEACKAYMDANLRGLNLRHVEVDEIWTFVLKKQGRLQVEEKAQRFDIGDVYLWTCIDQDSKLVPSFVLGKRSADNARKLMVDLRRRMVMPGPRESDLTGAYVQVTQISTDGFAGYPEAVDLAFGPYAKYGQIIKDYRNADQPGRYAPPEMTGTERKGIKGIRGKDQERTICTSHVERHNLTIRTLMKRFTRLSLGFSKKLANLEAAVAIFLAYYNFCWRTRLPGKSGRTRVPAAMAVGVSDTMMTFEELFDAVMGNAA